MNRTPGHVGSAWRWPVVIAVFTMAGLLMALLGNAPGWRVAAWCALAVPVIVATVSLVRRREG